MACMPYLNTLITWLKKDPALRERYMLPLKALGASFVLSFGLITVFALLGQLDLDTPSPLAGWDLLSWWFPVDLLVWVATLEEVMFRIIPLGIALRLWGVRAPTLLVLLGTAAIFGIAHGDYPHLFIQGSVGLLWGLLFIKFSRTGKDLAFPSVLVIGIHFLFDLGLAFIAVAAGETSF